MPDQGAKWPGALLAHRTHNYHISLVSDNILVVPQSHFICFHQTITTLSTMASSQRNDPTAISELSMPESVRENASLAARPIEVLSLGDPPAITLKKAPSVRSVVSTTSSLARRNQEASQDPHLQTLHLIGKGSFGMVFEHTGTTSVLKVEQYPIDSVAESIPKEGSSSAPDIIRSSDPH
jgi:hypothetical protein